MISTSENMEGADNALSYNLENGASFMHQKPCTDKSFEVQCSIPINKPLEEGVLFCPSAMEQKWAIFFRENKIIIVRSWQRIVFVTAETHQTDNQLIITKITGKFINSEEPEDFTKSALLFILHSYCLGEIVPVPIPEDLIVDTNVAALWVFSNFGNLAHYGYVGMDFEYKSKNYLKSDSLLHLAIYQQDIKAIHQHIYNGFNIHSLGNGDFSPLQCSLYASSDLLIMLLEKGLDVNLTNTKGETALMTATEFNKLEHLKILLRYDAIINARNKSGFTALHKAAEMGHFKIVSYLLEQGADQNILAKEHSPLSLAEASNRRKIIKLLKKAKA